MEVFWIVVGVVAVIIYVINQNKTKISDRTVVNHNKTIKTEDGEWICPYISRHLLSLNPLLACCRRYSRGER